MRTDRLMPEEIGMPALRVTSATPIDRTGRATRPLHVTIVAANTFEFDSRFLRSATTLAEDGHEVTVLGWAGPGLPDHASLAPNVRLTRLHVPRSISDALRPMPSPMRRVVCRLIGLDPATAVLPPDAARGLDRIRHPIRRMLEILANTRRVGPWTELVVQAAPKTDVFHCQSLVALPVARDAARRLNGRFVYDVADYHSEAERLARMPWVVREVVRRRERAWVRDAAGFLAVSDPVAELVARRWRIARPGVLLNCPPAWRPEETGPPVSDLLRQATGIAPERPVVLFHGGFSIDRGLEELLAALDEAALRDSGIAAVFMGYGRLQGYLDDRAKADPDRIHVLPAVSPDDLLPWIAGADVSFVGQPPWTLNHRMNLPNKLFESLMAGVPVIVSEDNEQCRLVTAEGVGVCVDIQDVGDIAGALSSLLSEPASVRSRMRAHCRAVALDRYTWEQNAGALVELYRRLSQPSV